MKFLTTAVLSTMLFAAGPALADRGHDRGHDKHHWKQSQHFDKHHGHYAPPRYVVRRDVHHYYPQTYYAPVPVYRPSAGIHVVLPNIYIPLR
jgi:hypothetical protein